MTLKRCGTGHLSGDIRSGTCFLSSLLRGEQYRTRGGVVKDHKGKFLRSLDLSSVGGNLGLEEIWGDKAVFDLLQAFQSFSRARV